MTQGYKRGPTDVEGVFGFWKRQSEIAVGASESVPLIRDARINQPPGSAIGGLVLRPQSQCYNGIEVVWANAIG